MRTFVVEKGANDLKSLATLLLGNRAGSEGVVDQLKNLNPHVDFKKKIEPGTVLLVPDAPGLRATAGSPVTGDAFDQFRDLVLASVKAAGIRVGSGYEALLGEQKEVAAVLKSDGLKQALKADPEIKAQIDAALQVFKQDQQEARAAEAMLKTLQQDAAAELAHLAKTLGGSI